MFCIRRCFGGAFRVSSQSMLYDTPLLNVGGSDGAMNSPEGMWALQVRAATAAACRWQVEEGTIVQPYADASQAMRGSMEEAPEVIDSIVYMYM